MTAGSHRIGAFAAFTTVIAFMGIQPQEEMPLTICIGAGALMGSLFPDADMPYSKIGRQYLSVLWPFYLFQFLIHLFAPRSYADKTFRHRGFFHYPLTWVIVFIPLFYWSNQMEWQFVYDFIRGMAIGVGSHLGLDLIAGGIPLLGPFSTRKLHLPIRVKTGGMIERVIALSMIVYSFIVILINFTPVKLI